MRKIEQEMWNAINQGYDWCKDNTQVTHEGDTANVYLHGHHIAIVHSFTGALVVNAQTLAKWPTNTTKSRLRALGANVTTKKGVTYLDGEEVC